MSNLTGNLLDPLEFGSLGEAMNFRKHHRCYCGRSLQPWHPRGQDKWYLECTKHGDVNSIQVISISQAEKAKDNERSGAYELRKDDPPEHTEEENMKALGFD